MTSSRHGFTLTEILIAATLLVLVGGAALSVFATVHRSMYGMSDAIDLNARTRLTQERILFDLRAVTKVTQATDRAFTGEFVEYASGRTGELSYSFDNGQLLRRVTLPGTPPATTVVMDELLTDTATSRFLYRNRTGEKDVPAASATEVRSIQIEFVPRPSARQSAGLVTGRNTPFASALVQLRNIGS